jgi:hypothetical protein
LSARVTRSCGIIAGAAIALAVAACGNSSPSAAAGNPATVHASYPVKVTAARFPASQRLAGRVRLVIAVRNTGHRALPDVAVTICNTSCAPSHRFGRGTAAAAFGQDVSGTGLATRSRPVWIVNRAPGSCHVSCNNPGGQAGSAVTANSNTWALGRLAPGRTARFSWAVTPVAAGRQVVAWQVAGDLTGAVRATVAAGGIPRGHFRVTVQSQPARSRVTPAGAVVTTGGS